MAPLSPLRAADGKTLDVPLGPAGPARSGELWERAARVGCPPCRAGGLPCQGQALGRPGPHGVSRAWRGVEWRVTPTADPRCARQRKAAVGRLYCPRGFRHDATSGGGSRTHDLRLRAGHVLLAASGSARQRSPAVDGRGRTLTLHCPRSEAICPNKRREPGAHAAPRCALQPRWPPAQLLQAAG